MRGIRSLRGEANGDIFMFILALVPLVVVVGMRSCCTGGPILYSARMSVAMTACLSAILVLKRKASFVSTKVTRGG